MNEEELKDITVTILSSLAFTYVDYPKAKESIDKVVSYFEYEKEFSMMVESVKAKRENPANSKKVKSLMRLFLITQELMETCTCGKEGFDTDNFTGHSTNCPVYKSFKRDFNQVFGLGVSLNATQEVKH